MEKNKYVIELHQILAYINIIKNELVNKEIKKIIG